MRAGTFLGSTSAFINGTEKKVKRRVNCILVASYALTKTEARKRKNAIRRKRRLNK